MGVAAKSGRKPKPVASKVLAGNPGGRPLNFDEPKFTTITEVVAPEHIDGIALEMWNRVSVELANAGILKTTDLQNLEVFCTAYQTYRECEASVKQNGILMYTENGNAYKNPALTAKNEAIKQMFSAGANLGLDPASRQRLVGSHSNTKDDNEFGDLIQ